MMASNIQAMIDTVFSLHGVRLSEQQAAAMLAERDGYATLLRDVSAMSCFEDEPSNYLHAQAGRRRWRGAAR